MIELVFISAPHKLNDMSWEKPSRGLCRQLHKEAAEQNSLTGKLMGMISVQRPLLSGCELQLTSTRQHCPTGRCFTGSLCCTASSYTDQIT